tara:strand:- start:32 stop:1378 length:1347 start_codon:yes stop_codon:yes gene_type:complete
MNMILIEDLLKKLSDYDDIIYNTIKERNPIILHNVIVEQIQNDLYSNSEYDSFNTLIKQIISDFIIHYELDDDNDNLKFTKKTYIINFTESYFRDKIHEYKNRLRNRILIKEKLEHLKSLKLPEQRTPEWYQIREQILTASSLADALGKGHFSSRKQLLLQKCGGPRGEAPFEIVEWGVMYEPVATKFYEILNNLTVLEFGLVPHPSFKIFGASPDGICDIDSPDEYIGRMLEIKCPPKRNFTKEVPEHYWMQIQGQLESCDLEECDFLQVKFIEYSNESEFIDDKYIINDKIKDGYTSNNLPKGLVLAFVTHNIGKNPTIIYEYSDFNQSYENLILWKDKILDEYKNKSYDNCIKHWWKIERYECTLVGRDRIWWKSVMPKIIDFWEDVLHYRENGIEELTKKDKKIKNIKIKEKDKEKNNEKTIITIQKDFVEKIQNDYLIDSDSD